jgi:hypothetical protein
MWKIFLPAFTATMHELAFKCGNMTDGAFAGQVKTLMKFGLLEKIPAGKDKYLFRIAKENLPKPEDFHVLAEKSTPIFKEIQNEIENESQSESQNEVKETPAIDCVPIAQIPIKQAFEMIPATQKIAIEISIAGGKENKIFKNKRNKNKKSDFEFQNSSNSPPAETSRCEKPDKQQDLFSWKELILKVNTQSEEFKRYKESVFCAIREKDLSQDLVDMIAVASFSKIKGFEGKALKSIFEESKSLKIAGKINAGQVQGFVGHFF